MPKYSKQVQDFLDRGGKITVVPPKVTAQKLEKMKLQPYKVPEIMGRRNNVEKD